MKGLHVYKVIAAHLHVSGDEVADQDQDPHDLVFGHARDVAPCAERRLDMSLSSGKVTNSFKALYECPS